MCRPSAAAWLVGGLALAVGAQAAGTRSSRPGEDLQPLEVAVSIGPLAELAERIGGDLVRVTVLTPPATPPESWSPTPREAIALTRADLYFSVGHPLLTAESTHLEAVAREVGGLERIRLTGSVAEDAASDPHLWMDIDRLEVAADQLAAWLAGRRPEDRAEVKARLASYEGALARTDRLLSELLTPPQKRPAVFQHPAWERLLARYGVETVTIEVEGKEASPVRLAGLVERVRGLEVRVVFSQVGVSDRGARLLAAEIDAEVVALDPTARGWLESLEITGSRVARAIQ